MANNLRNNPNLWKPPVPYGKYETGNSKHDWYKDTWVRPAGVDTLEEMGFYDSTNLNWAAPTWTHDGLALTVWVDNPVEYSQTATDPRSPTGYNVEHWHQYWITRCMYSSDDWEGIPDGYDAVLIATSIIAELVEFIKDYEYQDWTPPAPTAPYNLRNDYPWGKMIHQTHDINEAEEAERAALAQTPNLADFGVGFMHDFIDQEFSIDEMYALNTLEVGETCAIGVHAGYTYITRLT